MTNQDKNNDNLTPSNQGKINKYSSDLIKKGLDLARSIQNNDLITPKANFIELDKLLSQGQWQKADEKTAELMCEIIGVDYQWLNETHVKKFPKKELKIINDLWEKYSNGRFGFSIQSEIWVQCGGIIGFPSDSDEFGWSINERYGEKIGWRKNDEWLYFSELNFSIDAPVGHLPWLWGVDGFRFVGWWGNRIFYLLPGPNAEEIDYYDDDYYQSKADELFCLGNYQEALIYFEKLGYSEQCFNRGNELFELSEYETALQYYDKAIEMDMWYSSYKYWNAKAEVFVEMGCYQDALNCYDKSLEASDNSSAWERKIKLLLELERFNEADYTIEKNIEILQEKEKLYNNWTEKINHLKLWMLRAENIINNLGRYEEGIIYLDNALKISLEEIYTFLKSLGINEKETDEMRNSLESLRASIWDSRGFVLFELMRYEEAIESYNESLKIQPEQSKIWFNKGQIFFNMNMYDDAIYCYDQALIFEPKNSYFLTRKADTLKLLNRWLEVFECHQKIKEIEPDFIDT